MKNSFVFMLLSICYFSFCMAQEEKSNASEGYQFLFKSTQNSTSGFGSFLTSLGRIKGTHGLMIGGGGGTLINQSFFCGAYGMALAGGLESQLPSGESLAYKFKHGGLWLGYHFLPEKAVHFSLGLKGGFGRIRQEALSITEGASEYYLFDKIQVLSPELLVQLNLLPWFRMELGGSYQAVLGINSNDFYTKQDFNQLMGTLNLSFGWFKGH